MAKKVIPYGNRILVKRRKVGEKLGSGLILAADQTAERPTDLADVCYVPDHSFADKELIDNAGEIVRGLTDKSKQGDSDALISLLRFNDFLKVKAIQVGDGVMISKYVGTDFHDSNSNEMQTLVSADDIIGLVVDNG